jgi:chloramphenicol 3-O phosphotransferase
MPAGELARLRKFSKTKLINWDHMLAAYFRSAAAISDAGLDLILDCPLYDGRVALYNASIALLEPITVLLTCSPEELQRREMARGDRWVGLASYQAPRVANSIAHKFTFDSALTAVEDIGAKILSSM